MIYLDQNETSVFTFQLYGESKQTVNAFAGTQRITQFYSICMDCMLHILLLFLVTAGRVKNLQVRVAMQREEFDAEVPDSVCAYSEPPFDQGTVRDIPVPGSYLGAMSDSQLSIALRVTWSWQNSKYMVFGVPHNLLVAYIAALRM